MDRNSVRTSVVIEVANQEEPEDQKTYQIDFDDLDIPKDYVIDQVFCGENITVYALFEVPEDANVTTNDQLLDVSSPKSVDGYRFFQKNSSKKIVNQKNLNGFNQAESEESAVKLLPSKENGSESLYCLKHLSEEYDMLSPERENSDLKLLYSKSGSIKNSKSTKLKAVSKGVNTDIVQSPKIIQEVQKAVKQNIPFSKADRRIVRDKSLPSDKSSYEVIEMEMRQSFSSLSSHGDSRKASKKSIPNFFLVPLLMMDDGVLSHFQSEDKFQKVGENRVDEQPPDKISTGTNTDLAGSTIMAKRDEDDIAIPMSKSLKSETESDENQNLVQKPINSNSQPKQNSSKMTILSEIKKLQRKLNAFIKSIESSDFLFDESDNEKTEADDPAEKPTTERLETSETFLKSFRKNWEKFDDVPILSSLTYPACTTSMSKKKHTENSPEEKSGDISRTPTKSISMDFTSSVAESLSQTSRTDDKSKGELKMIVSDFKFHLSEVECRRGAGLSKSATTLTLSSQLQPRFHFINGIKKSLSFDLKHDKLEVSCLKKFKNISFKLDTKPNKRIPQKGEANLKCEMGDEAFNKPKSSKIDLLNLSKAIEKVENLKFEKIKLDTQKNLKEEEGDAKLVYSKKNVLSQMLGRTPENVGVHFCNTITRASENLLTSEKSLLPNPVKSKPTCSSIDAELKVCSDSDKPTTPNKTLRKGNMHCNIKRDVRNVKKLTNQTNKNKVGDKPPKADGKDLTGQEIITKQRSVTGNRKFTLKGTAESKLHVDRLMKLENLNNPKTTNVEKPGIKGDRTSRLPSQKREPTDPPHDIITAEVKGKTEKMTTASITSINKNDVKKGTKTISEKNGEAWEGTSEGNPSRNVLNQPGVVVELLDEKPTFSPQENQHSTNLKNSLPAEQSPKVKESPKAKEAVNNESLKREKPVVKSVWALTKVLLFEDGTKKIEILEASLTPPGYSLPKIPP